MSELEEYSMIDGKTVEIVLGSLFSSSEAGVVAVTTFVIGLADLDAEDGFFTFLAASASVTDSVL